MLAAALCRCNVRLSDAIAFKQHNATPRHKVQPSCVLSGGRMARGNCVEPRPHIMLSNIAPTSPCTATVTLQANMMKKVLAGEDGDGQLASDGEGSSGANVTQQETAQQPTAAVAAAAASAMQQPKAQEPLPAVAAAAVAASMPQLTEDELCCPITSEIMEDPVSACLL